MNVYEKLQAARCELQKLEMKKSGNNKFAGYNYFELGDFLPEINTLMKDHKLSGFTQFTSDAAMLTIVNSEAPDERVVFTSPMGSAQLKGCHEVQNIGAVETYQRRYLYMMAFEIVEHDPIDGAEPAEPVAYISPQEALEISNLAIKLWGRNKAQQKMKELTGYSSTTKIPADKFKSVKDKLAKEDTGNAPV